MIELGLHTDNWRPLSGSFETACEARFAMERACALETLGVLAVPCHGS